MEVGVGDDDCVEIGVDVDAGGELRREDDGVMQLRADQLSSSLSRSECVVEGRVYGYYNQFVNTRVSVYKCEFE